MDKWLGATQPKIKGTWNLHSCMPHDLDFFIILSSMSGIIGNTAQANYCAGNTYEDALAHYRHKQGLAATTLNVGLVTDASHFNESSTIEDYLKQYSHWMPARVTDHEMQVTLAAAMRGQTANGIAVPTQLLVGITDDIERDGLNLWPNDRKFDHRAKPSSGSSSDSSKSQLERSKTVEDAAAAVRDALRTNVATAITAAPEDIDVEKPLYSFGSTYTPQASLSIYTRPLPKLSLSPTHTPTKFPYPPTFLPSQIYHLTNTPKKLTPSKPSKSGIGFSASCTPKSRSSIC